MQRYPLTWPTGWKRTGTRKSAKFSKGERRYSTDGQQSWMRRSSVSIAEGTKRVLRALSMLGVREGDAIISSNLELRLDDLPRSGQREPSDPGVAVYWTRQRAQGQKVMAIDLYDRVADNLAAIAATLEAMRAIERHGGAMILERAFTGFEALPSPNDWRHVMGFRDTPTFTVAKARYRELATKRHPDNGGTDAAMAELNAAWQSAQRELA